jgi:hypothetical protein
MSLMRGWVRPYEAHNPDWLAFHYVLAAGMSLCAGLSVLGGIVTAGVPLASAPFLVLFWIMWTILLWRMVTVGLYVNDHGIKVRFVHRTHVIAWSDVTRAWAGPAAHYDAWQIWISARGPDRDVQTPIWRRSAWRVPRNRVVLAPEEFAALLNTLNARADQL